MKRTVILFICLLLAGCGLSGTVSGKATIPASAAVSQSRTPLPSTPTPTPTATPAAGGDVFKYRDISGETPNALPDSRAERLKAEVTRHSLYTGELSCFSPLLENGIVYVCKDENGMDSIQYQHFDGENAPAQTV